jgi:hypothetical protein
VGSTRGLSVGSVLVVEVEGKTSSALKAEITPILSSNRPVVLVRVKDGASDRHWSELVPGVDPIPETVTAVAAGPPSEIVLSRIMETVHYSRATRRLRRASAATLVAGIASIVAAAALGLLASAAKVTQSLSEDEAQLAQKQEARAKVAATDAAAREREAVKRSQVALDAAKAAERRAAAYSAQLAAIRDFLRPKPSLGPEVYSSAIKFDPPLKGDIGWREGRYWRHYKLTPRKQTLPPAVRDPAFTFYHAVGQCTSHVLQAASRATLTAFEYDGYACYGDIRALFLSEDGSGVAATKTSACSSNAKPMVCP